MSGPRMPGAADFEADFDKLRTSLGAMRQVEASGSYAPGASGDEMEAAVDAWTEAFEAQVIRLAALPAASVGDVLAKAEVAFAPILDDGVSPTDGERRLIASILQDLRTLAGPDAAA